MTHSLPLRYSIPLVLVLVGVTQTVVVTWFDVRSEARGTERNTRRQAVAMGGRNAARLGDFLLAGEQRAAERDVERLGSQPFVRHVRLSDDSDRELAASPAGPGVVATTFEGDRARLSTAARGSGTPQVEVIGAGQALAGAFPVTLALSPDGRGPSRLGVLYLEFDLVEPYSTRLGVAYQRAAIIGGLSFLSMLLSWWYFDRKITGRVGSLASTAAELARGNLAAQSPLRGRDEFATLGATLNTMAVAIRDRDAAARDREQVLRLFRAQIDQAHDAIYVLDPYTFAFLDVNERGCLDLGYSREELLRLTVFDIDPGVDPAGGRSAREAMSAGDVLRFETFHRRKDGTTFPVEVASRRVHADRDSVVAVSRDITDRRQAQAALAASAHRYETLVNNLEGIVWEADARTFRFTFVSRQAERLLGYPVSRWVEEPTFWSDHIHPEDRGAAVKYCMDCTAQGVAHDFEYRMVAEDGRAVWVHDIVTVELVDGRPVTLRGVMVDVTERHRAEQTLRLFRAQVERANDAMEVVDPRTGRFVDVNERACRDLGYSRDELLALSLPDIDAGSDPSRYEDNLARLRASGEIYVEAVHRRKDGTTFPVEVAVRLVRAE